MEIGKHLIVDIFEVTDDTFREHLSEEKFPFFDKLVTESIERNNMHILDKKVHFFPSTKPGAFTLFYLLSESHLSIHTWPERNYLALDIFTCGNCNTRNILDDILTLLNTRNYNIQFIKRGIY